MPTHACIYFILVPYCAPNILFVCVHFSFDAVTSRFGRCLLGQCSFLILYNSMDILLCAHKQDKRRMVVAEKKQKNIPRATHKWSATQEKIHMGKFGVFVYEI